MKTCPKCKQKKEDTAFSKNASRKDELFFWCKKCARSYCKRYVNENKEAVNANRRRAYKADPERIRERNRKWHDRNRADLNERNRIKYAADPTSRKNSAARYRKLNPEKFKNGVYRWVANHRGTVNAYFKRRRALKLKAFPKWANEFFIEEAYDLAALRTAMLGFPWHVDHIVPLISKRVCGLHVENNLQVIPGVENIKKGNRHWPDMPGA